nr:MAG TPA: hypothetical protein [Caudoviricetes sp.]
MPNTGKTQRVVLGAGKWYIAPYTSGALDMETVGEEDNLLGYTQGGATITFTPETYTIEDDIGMVRKTFQTKASAKMKTGLLTFTTDSLAAMLSVGQATQTPASASERGKTTLKLGGGKSALKKFSVVFVYEDDETGFKTRIGMVATNTAPLELVFAKDAETVVDVTFTAESNGVDDTIIVIEEETAEATGDS